MIAGVYNEVFHKKFVSYFIVLFTITKPYQSLDVHNILWNWLHYSYC